MNRLAPTVPANSAGLPNGSGAAAILAAGIGSFMVAVLAIAADNSAAVKSLLNFYRPSGPLSGVTTFAVLVWLIAWGISIGAGETAPLHWGASMPWRLFCSA